MPPKNTSTHKDHPEVSTALPGITAALRNGNLSQAITSATNLLDTAPNDARLHDLLSTALALAAYPERAVHHAQRALTLNPNDTPLSRRTISVLQRAGHYNEALAHTERALYQSPKDPILNKIKVTLLTDLGKHRNAAKALERFNKDNPPSTPVDTLQSDLLSARLSPSHYAPADIIPNLVERVSDDSLPAPLRKATAFQLARLQEHESNFDTAFQTYTLANKLAIDLTDQSWNPADHSKRIDHLIAAGSDLSNIPASTTDGSNIVFILGMMRSGSSLLEQLLAQLQGLTPAGEQSELLTQIAKLERKLSPDQPQSFPTLPLSSSSYTQDHINAIAQATKARYDQFSTTTLVTDKQTEHYHLIPLLPKLFPGCTIIHTNRDPLDTCFSNYTQSYAQGHPHTAKLEWIAQYHNDHDRLMSAYHALPNITIHEVNYTDLVTNPEQVTKHLAEILSLEWTKKVLDFHKSTRTIATASQDQVRQPLNTNSVGRAQRFEKHLEPLRQSLSSKD